MQAYYAATQLFLDDIICEMRSIRKDLEDVKMSVAFKSLQLLRVESVHIS